MVHFARHWTDPFAGSLQIVDRCILSLCDRIPARHRAVRSLKMRAFEHRSFRSLPDAARSRRYSKREPEPATRHASDVSTAVGIGWRVAAWAALARACASGAGAAWPFSTSAIELKDNKRPRAPPRNQRTPAVSEQVMVPVTSSCQLSVAVDAQSTDLCRAGATSRYGERCAQLPWCAHPSSDVWRPLAQPLSTISTHTPWWRRLCLSVSVTYDDLWLLHGIDRFLCCSVRESLEACT